MVNGNNISNVLSSLFLGKGQRVSDVCLEYPGYAQSEVSDALEALVATGDAEKYVHSGETYYLKKV
jgi:hypothetical protein